MPGLSRAGADTTDPFSPDYATARTRFLDAARRVGARIESIAITPTGPHGEPLFIDTATTGPADAPSVVIVSSGLHGVEGFVGSAIQLAWLGHSEHARSAAEVKVVLAHGLNPYGFAWLRRPNEHNVDLNRNFLVDRTFLAGHAYRASLSVYDRLSSFLNPETPPARWEPYTVKAIGHVLRAGFKALQQALPVGQYQHRTGLFYGGDAPEASTTILRGLLPAWTDGARLAVHLDLHSGIGPWADARLLIADVEGSPRARWVLRHFGADVRPSGERGAYRAHGTMTEDFRNRARPCMYHGLTTEFGTYSAVKVLGALRAENRAHFFAPPNGPAYHRAKQQLLDAFVPQSRRWRARVVRRGTALVDRAIEVCRDERRSGSP
jgi:hypothetical protein